MAKVLKNKSSKGLIITIIMIVIFSYAVFSFHEVLGINSLGDLEEFVLDLKNSRTNSLELLFLWIEDMIIFIFNPLTICFICYKVIIFFYNLSKIKHKIHPKFNIQYFRDDLKNVSPALVSFLVNLDLNMDRDVPAHILKLMLDGYIKEENNQYVVTNKNRDTLKIADCKLLEYVESDFRNQDCLNAYEKGVIQDAINSGYIKNSINVQFWLKLIFLPFLLSFISIIFFFTIGNSVEINSVLYVIAIIAFIAFGVVLEFSIPFAIFMLILTLVKKDSYSRTKKGNVLLEQIMGLKNYLNDFSNLDKSSLDDLILREYYLVYSIVLEINTKIDDEILLKIQKQIKS